MSTRAPTPLAGIRLGQYSLDELLGEGAMARVFRATQHGAGGFKKQVALKLVRGRATEDSDALENFINEARIGGYLRHPNIVEVYGFS